MQKPLISVIVPVYNVEHFLRYCVDSIIEQTYKNIEIILIDDGSTDASGTICDEYEKKDFRIKVIHKENGGLSDARNKGMQKACGEYYAFVDSDDFIARDYIAYLFELIDKNKAQISVCGYLKFYNYNIMPQQRSKMRGSNFLDFGFRRNERMETNTKNKVCVYQTEEAIFHLLYQNGIVTAAWGKLFHRSLFDKIAFPIGKLHEDIAIIYQLFDNADKVVCSKAEKYFYFQRNNSIKNSAFNQQRMDYIFFTKECIQYMAKVHPNLWKAAVSRHFSACFELLTCIENNRKIYPDVYKELVGEIKKYRRIVMLDCNARQKNRLAAAGTYLSLRTVLTAVQFLEKRKQHRSSYEKYF